MYAVKEVFLTLQGEGYHAGRAAVFCRFVGCNLWSGHERDRQRAICQFCDTDFIGTDGPGGGRFPTANGLAAHIESMWPSGERGFVVFTGGEPLLQLDTDLLAAVRQRGFTTAVETNGTLTPPPGIDWLCVSPKADSPLAAAQGDELKLVFPQVAASPGRFEGLAFRHFYLQPMDGPDREANTAAAADWCMKHPRWKLSVQMHKMIGIP
jgi:7-carboxy-7-deazaguanine synthase